MATLSVRMPAAPSEQDLLLGLLDDFEFEGFEQRDDALLAFIPESAWSDIVEQRVRTVVSEHVSAPLEVNRIEDRNWNADWEKSIQARNVGRFRVRPTWDTTGAAADEIDLIIDPKMSFGTAYHESTRLLLRRLPEFVAEGDVILDAGTGTGILAIAALKCGAARAVGFDVDPWSIINAVENAELNGVSDRLDLREGTEDVLRRNERFDVIFANINRDVLLAMLPVLGAAGDIIALAGLLITDRPAVCARLEELGLAIVEESSEGEWWSVWVRRVQL